MDMTARRILIVNDNADCGFNYAPLLKDLGEIDHNVNSFLLNPYQYKLIQFTGGSDVSPELYGHTSPRGICSVDWARDELESKIFHRARNAGIKMLGICRGMQFLNVMCSGKMIHHVTEHSAGRHSVSVSCSSPPRIFEVNSYHHQMVIPPDDAHIIAWSTEKLSKSYIGDKDEEMKWYGPEVEGIYVPGDRVIGVQWHPEALDVHHAARRFYVSIIKDYLNNHIIEFRKKYVGVEHATRATYI